MFDLVFKDAQLRDGFQTFVADLAVAGGTIAAIGTGLAGRREIRAAGKWLLPGFLDVHTHLSLPFAGAVSADDFFTGSRAGAFGGVTTLIDFTAQRPGEGLREGFERRLAEARGRAAIDFSFHACIGREIDRPLADLAWAVETGLTSLKVFMAYSRAGLMQDDAGLFKVMEHCRKAGVLVTVHAENGGLIDFLTDRLLGGTTRPNPRGEPPLGERADALPASSLGIGALPLTRPVYTEVEAISRLGHLARATGAATYIVHVSSGDGATALATARRHGAPLLGETCPQYLYLNDAAFGGERGHDFSCCPPLRAAGQAAGLWAALQAGDLQVVATDHCPFRRADKDRWEGDITRLPMGLPGIETLGPLTLWGGLNRHIPLDTAIRALTAHPARLFGLYPRKGSLQPGADADLVLFDPDRSAELTAAALHMGSDYSPYEGLRGAGWPVMTVSRGEIIVENGRWLGEAGRGQFLARGSAQLDGFLPD
ncbi:MAG: Dihydropyrimidinase [Candidatus Ozemobacter sibiricus]|jgi:dihydropyrimidinase|uniref:D-hydantoinase n=1 Tax=Candidatus Ozemobacter sibiricus TaxID=2268124 RepID=A0A367ZN73_9BACT|nr:MAG: Dihydropyrimidinase [Candidatus Ozemobacter sibiricus]